MVKQQVITTVISAGTIALVGAALASGQSEKTHIALLVLALAFLVLLIGYNLVNLPKALKASRKIDEVNINALPDALIISEVNGEIEIINNVAQKLFPKAENVQSIRQLFEPFHAQLTNPGQAEEVVEAVLSAPRIQFSELLTMQDGRAFERSTKRMDNSSSRLWIIRDVTQAQSAQHDSAMHQSLVEADAARNAALAEQLFHAKAELEAKQAELTRLANTDSLTGLLNRRRFTTLSEKAVSEAAGTSGLWVIMMDIDHFKRVNDTYGHAAGDVAIRDFAEIVQRSVDDQGIVGRMGGEEFAAVLTACDEATCFRIAETIRKTVAAHKTISGTEKLRFTVSIGVAQWTPEEDSIEPALARADQALYSAKMYGRNRVVGYESGSL